jgi:hypothetical protein
VTGVSAEAGDLLSLCAVLGRGFDFPTLQTLRAADDDTLLRPHQSGENSTAFQIAPSWASTPSAMNDRGGPAPDTVALVLQVAATNRSFHRRPSVPRSPQNSRSIRRNGSLLATSAITHPLN